MKLTIAAQLDAEEHGIQAMIMIRALQSHVNTEIVFQDAAGRRPAWPLLKRLRHSLARNALIPSNALFFPSLVAQASSPESTGRGLVSNPERSCRPE